MQLVIYLIFYFLNKCKIKLILMVIFNFFHLDDAWRLKTFSFLRCFKHMGVPIEKGWGQRTYSGRYGPREGRGEQEICKSFGLIQEREG